MHLRRHSVMLDWINNRGRWDLNALRLWNRFVCLDDSRITKKIFIWDMKEHHESNKANFCAHVKQVLCEMGKKESCHRMEQINLINAKVVFLEREKSRWFEEAVKLSKLDLLTKIKNIFGAKSFLSPPVHIAHMQLLSVRPSVCPSVCLSLHNNSCLGKYYSYESERARTDLLGATGLKWSWPKMHPRAIMKSQSRTNTRQPM